MSQVDTAESNLSATSSSGGVPSVTLRQKQDTVHTAENALKLAEENLVVLQTQTPHSLVSEEQAFQSTVTSVDINVQLKQNDISQRLAALQKIRKQLDDYRLIAPFDGVIRHIDYKSGDNLLDTGDTESLTLENPSLIVVTIPLDQIDVVNVHATLQASVTFDAVPGRTFPAMINDIDATPIQQSGVVSYNVHVALPTPEGLTILSGMTSTVTIETARKANALTLPNLALRRTAGRTLVQTSSGESISVTTGITDGEVTEILSGVREGDSVLALNLPANQSSAGNTNAAQQLLRATGGGGFGGGAGRTGGNQRSPSP